MHTFNGCKDGHQQPNGAAKYHITFLLKIEKSLGFSIQSIVNINHNQNFRPKKKNPITGQRSDLQNMAVKENQNQMRKFKTKNKA